MLKLLKRYPILNNELEMKVTIKKELQLFLILLFIQINVGAQITLLGDNSPYEN